MTETYNLAEAAEYLKLGYEATKELFDSGVLPGVSLNQRHTVFHRADLEAFLRETARRQAAERRANIKPEDRVAARPRATGKARGAVPPDLSIYERRTDSP